MSRGADIATTAILRPARDGRLLPYCLFAVGGLAGSVVAGEAALAALAVPFALVLALGLRRTGPVRVQARLALESDQVVEGDLLAGFLELEWDGEFDAEILLDRLQGVEPAPGAEVEWSFTDARRTGRLPVRFRSTRWGRHAAAEVWLRLSAPHGLLSWTGRLLTGPTLRVLPTAERLNRLLDPAESRTVLGVHRSPRIGDGGEFAQLRPYQPGDRLRDLNWAATARHGRPFVNRYHPELSGDVVIALDAFSDGAAGSATAHARAARAAWALASVHLKANDRVGLAAIGGRTRWLPPAGGRLARYRLLETLLSIGEELGRPPTADADYLRAIPASALIITITPLHDALTIRAMEAWRARGRAVAVVTIDTIALLAEPAGAADALARRLWRFDIEGRKRRIAALGIPLVEAPSTGSIAPMVSALRRGRRAPSVRVGA